MHMPERINVMISSTVLDLPEHRKEIIDACLRQGMLPLVQEQLPASAEGVVSASLKLVDSAEIYIALLGHRYGYVPEQNNPQHISITEMEYNRAVERGLLCLTFLIDKSHPITLADLETGEGAAKLSAFKVRLQADRVVNYFKSPADLRAQVITRLSSYRRPDLTTFHYVGDIPEPPEAYIAHPYTLLRTRRLVGRREELDRLTDWVTKRQEEVYWNRILNVVAIGGVGKSALTWKWFNDIAPQEMRPMAGRLWWSFYESDASFENFITRALAYTTRRSIAEVREIPPSEREAQLLAVLDRDPFLLVLDGFERILVAYARMDAAYLSDDDRDRQTANGVAETRGLPKSAAQAFSGEHRLRKTADPRAGAFLRKLANVRAARILITTRLYPADLQKSTGEPQNGSTVIFLRGLTNDDALDLWRAIGANGGREALMPLFNQVENHPLLIQALASEVADYRRAPGDFEQWRRDHPGFNPFTRPMVNVKSHVLEFALRGLNDQARQVLHTVAAFRMPASYDTLAALLVGEGKPCVDERQLDELLTTLEDRGLLGWDKRANRYDLHPIVRGVVWAELGDESRRNLYQTIHAYFESTPVIDDWRRVNSIEDLTPAIELYNTLIGLERYDDAELVFYDRISRPVFYRLGASRQQVELLEMLFPDGIDQLPRVSRPDMQAFALNALALAYDASGNPGHTAPLYRRQIALQEQVGNMKSVGIAYCNMSNALLLSNAIYGAESAARRSLLIARDLQDHNSEAISLYTLGFALLARGLVRESEYALRRALQIRSFEQDIQSEGIIYSHLAQQGIWAGDYLKALSLANRAWESANIYRNERNFIRAARLQGTATLRLGNFVTADERLHHALTRARAVNLVEEELPALVALAELRRQGGDLKAARELLDDVWEAAERGPYPLFQSDACIILALIERDAGLQAEAIEAAMRAYRLAWGDGPPFAYHWGLANAKQMLQEFGEPAPLLPPFEESKFDPMAEVEIDPNNEWPVGKESDA